MPSFPSATAILLLATATMVAACAPDRPVPVTRSTTTTEETTTAVVPPPPPPTSTTTTTTTTRELHP
jgi:hypothetical protein